MRPETAILNVRKTREQRRHTFQDTNTAKWTKFLKTWYIGQATCPQVISERQS